MSNKQLSIILKMRDEASKKLKGFSGNMQRFANQVRKHWKAVSLVIMAVVAAIAKVMKQAVAYGVQLDEMAKQASITTEEFSRLAYAAEQEHASLETLTKIFPILTKYMEYSRMGMMTYKREFDKMGIGVTDTTGKLKSTYHVFLEMADYYSKAEDKTKALAIAVTLLGRRGAEVIPLLRLGRQGIEELGDEAERLGVVMSQETAAKMKEFDDTMVRLKTALRGLGIEMAKGLIGPLGKLANALMKAIPTIKFVFALIRSGFLQVTSGFLTMSKYINIGFQKLLVPFQKFYELLGKLPGRLGENFRKIAEGGKEQIKNLKENIKLLDEAAIKAAEGSIKAAEEAAKQYDLAFAKTVETIKKGAEQASNNIKAVTEEVKKAYANMTDKLKRLTMSQTEYAKLKIDEQYEAWKKLFEGNKEMLANLEQWHEAAYNNITTKTKEKFNAIGEFAKQSARNMQNAFSQFFFKAFTGELKTMSEVFANFGKAILQMISNILAKLLLIKMITTMAGPSGTIFGVAVNTLFHEGGTVRRGQRHIIRAHRGLAPDEVPIIAETGEGILSRRGMSALGGSNNLRALNRGGELRGGGLTINVNQVIQAWDAQDVWRNRKMLSNAIADDIYNNGKIRSVIRSYA